LKICPLGWNRSSKTPQRIVAERAKGVNTYQDINSQELKFSELVKQSRRKRRKLVLVEIAKTVSTHHDINSQELKIDELVKQSSRKRRKLVVVEFAKH